MHTNSAETVDAGAPPKNSGASIVTAVAYNTRTTLASQRYIAAISRSYDRIQGMLGTPIVMVKIARVINFNSGLDSKDGIAVKVIVVIIAIEPSGPDPGSIFRFVWSARY
jgi:hypothetical protein